ncbi:MAG: Phosphoserine phosphatase RsbU [Pelotomaculum sp. PtaB.Bin013]|uniref:Serine/threonine-protein phosphatase n=1 Tax=Pelotomaculum isophthalicicum JI TaxID=947010 RepID=A0A9X4JW27_9FIRM|nr:PP2C family protein-serine/threonine phosphatase [Pelotomaculum isophthalicicum]MDF9409401.1 serine/threonine-protein phosphatase [Pelotomaculum isophthalicicum JI]OPX91757.1 MAG: Phosphoserine phosphatase RsbU [Pelotomaculum sp. PtaB.Bin013]
MLKQPASRRLKGRIWRLAACMGAVAFAVITLGNQFIQGVTFKQQVAFYLPVVSGQCLFVVLALYALSAAYLRPVLDTLDCFEEGREPARQLVAKARRAAFNYPLDMLVFLALCGIGLILIFHFSEWFFFYKGDIPANWWLATFQAAAFELTLTVSLALLFFAFARRPLREFLEKTTGLAPDEGKRLAIRSRLLITIISIVVIAASTFLYSYLFFPLEGKPLPIGLFLILTVLIAAFCVVVGVITASDTARDIVLVTGKLEQITRGIRPGLHQTLAVTSLDEVGDLVVAFNRLQRQAALTYREVDRELALARSVQAELLPKEFPFWPGWEVAGRSLSARQVGGDFYDHIPLAGGRFGLAVGDAAGKGMPAALLMAAVIGLLRAEAPREESPAKVLGRVNDLICGTVSGGMFITALYAVFDPAAGICTLASAGHLSPVRFLPDGTGPELVDTGALPLGLASGVSYRETTLAIPPGGGMAFYTDGIVEARNVTGELYGFPRFLDAFRFSSGSTGEAFILSVIDEVSRFTGGEQEDDLTLLVVRRLR